MTSWTTKSACNCSPWRITWATSCEGWPCQGRQALVDDDVAGEKLVKIGAKVVQHARYVVFQMAEVAIPRGLFRAILERIRRLRPPAVVFR